MSYYICCQSSATVTVLDVDDNYDKSTIAVNRPVIIIRKIIIIIIINNNNKLEKSNDYFESMQYRQDVSHIAHYHKRNTLP